MGAGVSDRRGMETVARRHHRLRGHTDARARNAVAVARQDDRGGGFGSSWFADHHADRRETPQRQRGGRVNWVTITWALFVVVVTVAVRLAELLS